MTPAARRRTSPASELSAADTIVAVATPAGESAIGVVRLSGADAVAVAARVIRAREPLTSFESHTLHRVSIVETTTGSALDDAMCAVMRGPRSYTGEDVVELSCHGSPALLHAVVEQVRASGARLAEPGEFTRRAFLNGRLDLARAEAVALLISARTTRAVKLAARALAGDLAAELRRARHEIVDLIAGLEVTLDFPEERVGLAVESAVRQLQRIASDVARWSARARHGRVVHTGITVAIVGPPNAGKSSLLNALVGQDRAIVSPTPGTTRDVVEATIAVGGVPIRLLDTAGIGDPANALEAEGMRRTRMAAEESDLLVVVLDGSAAPDTGVLEDTKGRSRIVVRAKSDLPADEAYLALAEAVAVSSRTGAGVDRLLDRLGSEVALRTGSDDDENGLVATLRQVELLAELQKALVAARAALESAPLEAALVDLTAALRYTGDLLGVEVGDVVLDRVFAMFCVGK